MTSLSQILSFAPRFVAVATGLALISLSSASGCKSAKKNEEPAQQEKAEKKEDAKPEVALAEQNPNGSWKISDHGVRFEPPIPKTQLPDKVWFCDMGTVHYARLQQGDEICPLCKMKLKQFNLDAGPAAAGAAAGAGAHGHHAKAKAGGHAGH